MSSVFCDSVRALLESKKPNFDLSGDELSLLLDIKEALDLAPYKLDLVFEEAFIGLCELDGVLVSAYNKRILSQLAYKYSVELDDLVSPKGVSASKWPILIELG